MNLKLLLNTQMIWMVFMKILESTIQILIYFNDMVADMLNN